MITEREEPDRAAIPSGEGPGRGSDPPGPPAGGDAAPGRRRGQFEAIQAISAEITRELDLTRLLRLIIERALGLVGAPAGAIFLWDEEHQFLVPQAWIELEDWVGKLRLRLGEGAGGLAALRREGVLQNDCRTSQAAPPIVMAHTVATAALAEPLLYRERLLGIILANHTDATHRFTTEDQTILRVFATQAAIAIENARLFQEAQKRVVQLDTVRAVTAEVTRELELSTLLRLISQRSIELLGAGSGAVVLWDEAAQVLVPAAWHGHDDWYGAARWRLGEGVLGTVAKRREGLVVNDYRNSPYAHPLFLLRTEITATIAEPLLYHDRLLGVVTVDGYGEGRAFTDPDRQLLNLFAAQAAIAIENARLHEATQKELADRIRAEEDLRQSEEQARGLAQENAAMAEIGRIISSTLNIEEVYESFADEVRKLIVSDRIVINSINVEKNVVRNLYIAGERLPDRNVSDLYPLEGSGNAEMVRTRASVLIQAEDLPEYADRLPALISTFRAGYQSILNVPLFAKGQVIGGLLLRSRTPKAYTAREVRLAERIGAQIAGAIANTQLYLENARLYEAAVRRETELEALLRATRSLSAALDLQEILDRIVAEASHIANAPHVKVLLLDQAAKVLRVAAAKGTATPVGYEFALGTSFSGLVAQTGEPLFQADSPADPRNLFAQTDRDLGIVTYLGLPIKRGEEVLGVLTFNATVPHEYAAEELAYLAAFADQAAVAIENARLYAASKGRARELEALREIEQAITSRLELPAVLEAVVAGTMRLLDNPFAQIILWDEASQTLRFGAARGAGAERVRNQKFELGRGINGVVAQTRQPMILDDYQASPYSVPECFDVVATISVPILFGDRLLGVLHSHTTAAGRRFTPDDLRRLQMLATQAAIAIENARLHHAAVLRGAELEALLRASRAIGSSLDPDEVLQTIAQQAAEISTTPIVRLFILEEETQLLRCRVAVGFPLEEARELVISVGGSLSGQVAATGEPLAVADTREDPRTQYPAHIAKYSVVSYLGLPVKLQDRLFGVLVFNTRTPRTYSKEEVAFLASFAQQAALAIQNARFYEAAVRRGAELEALLRATSSIMSGLDVREILQRIVAEAASMAGVPYVGLMLVDKPAQVLRLVAAVGDPVPSGTQTPIGVDFTGHVAQTGEILYSSDSPNDPRNRLADRDRALGLKTYLGLPIKIEDEVLGVLTFETTTPRRYTPDELAYLTSFTTQAAIAIENARLHEAVQRHAANLEARVAERTAALEEALRAKAEFLAKMSHELRTPLNFVLGFAELLKQCSGGALTPKQDHYLDRIVSGGKHLLDLVTDLLDLSLLEAGRKGLRLESIPLAPLVREVLDLFGVQVTQKRMEVRQTVEPGLTAVAERRKLIQILTNLVANAVKFTPDGGVITVAARRVSGPGGQSPAPSPQPPAPASDFIEIAVEDTGTGLAPEDLERIFRGFEQVDGSPTRQHGGAGIGLALVRTLVELHGGTVWAESAGVRHGARFVVRLPWLDAPPPKRVLVVEDQAPLLKTLCVFLRDAGYGVEGTGTGGEALEAILERRPDLVILDIGLPDINGWEVLRRVRADERTHGLPVLILTGLGEVQANQAVALGANEFLTKPFSPSAMIGIVRELLTGEPRLPGPPAPGADA